MLGEGEHFYPLQHPKDRSTIVMQMVAVIMIDCDDYDNDCDENDILLECAIFRYFQIFLGDSSLLKSLDPFPVMKTLLIFFNSIADQFNT